MNGYGYNQARAMRRNFMIRGINGEEVNKTNAVRNPHVQYQYFNRRAQFHIPGGQSSLSRAVGGCPSDNGALSTLPDQDDCTPNVLRRPYEPPPEVRLNSPNVRLGRGRGQPIPGNSPRTPDFQNPGTYEIMNVSSNSMGAINHSDLTHGLSSMSLASNTVAVPKLKSTLSAEAPEFIPRIGMSQQYPQPQDPNLIPAHLQISGTNMGLNVGEQNIPHIFQPQLKYISHPVILQVNDLVYSLAWKPHRFDAIANQLTSILSWKVKELDLMKEVISVIFEEGVGEQNFRYSGGRLCQHLSKHTVQSYDGPTFKVLLLQKCQEEFLLRDYYLQVNPERLCGFTTFLSEIYKKLLTPGGQPLEKLREGICTLLMTLMSTPTAANLKCVANLLKATGCLLEMNNSDDFEKVMCRLKDVVMTAKIPENIRSMLLSVIELRASNWGRKVEDTVSSAPSGSGSDVPPMGTVFYGPGGVIQSIEEDNDDSASDTDDAYIRYRDTEKNHETFDEEDDVALAYEEFLREQEQENFVNQRHQFKQNSSPYYKHN